jgi:hypothetical protein
MHLQVSAVSFPPAPDQFLADPFYFDEIHFPRGRTPDPDSSASLLNSERGNRNSSSEVSKADEDARHNDMFGDLKTTLTG